MNAKRIVAQGDRMINEALAEIGLKTRALENGWSIRDQMVVDTMANELELTRLDPNLEEAANHNIKAW